MIGPRDTINDSGSGQFGRAFIVRRRYLITHGWPDDFVSGPDIVEMSDKNVVARSQALEV